MIQHLVDGLVVFIAITAALLLVGCLSLVWLRRRVSMIRARLITRAAAGDFSFGEIIAALRVNRYTMTTARVRRRLRVDVAGAIAAVEVAQRSGAVVGEMGDHAARLDTAARSLENVMASMGTSGVTPTVLAKAGELGIAAHRLRNAAEIAAARAAVPDHGELVGRIETEYPHPTEAAKTRWRSLGH